VASEQQASEQQDLGAYGGEQESLAEDVHRQEAHDVGKGDRADLHGERLIHESRWCFDDRLRRRASGGGTVAGLLRRWRRPVGQVRPEENAGDEAIHTHKRIAQEELIAGGALAFTCVTPVPVSNDYGT
jgi:hypothetical protein